MAINAYTFWGLLRRSMEPVFIANGFARSKESGIVMWHKQLDAYGDCRAAISYEKSRGRFTFRLYVADNNFFDLLSYRRSYIPSRSTLKQLGTRKSKLGLLVGDDWLPYPSTKVDDDTIARGLQAYAQELVDRVDYITPAAIKWLGKAD